MDKLQPLIKHRYWICFGLSVIFVLVGWWMASGAIATEIDNGRKSVDGAFSKAKQGANDPNAKWVEGANERNKQDEVAFTAASTELRERQQNARQWPEAVRDEMKGIAYQGPITNHVSREKWASIYKDEIEALLAIVKPFEQGEGLVVVTPDRITHKPFDSWRFGPPQSKEIWDAQEDIWLLRSLLTSIASVNGDAGRITESSVREIQRLWLRGGDPAATPSSGGGAGGMGGMDSMAGMGAMSGNMSMGGGGMGGGGTTTTASHPGKEFEGNSGSDILGEEFGPDSSNGGSGGMGGGDGGTMMGSPPGGKGGFSSGMMGMMGAGGAGGETAAPAEEKRYVHEVEGSYKTRAFLLDVMVRDDKLPELLAALTDSDFPVEIVRVEINALPGAGGATGGMGGMSSMGGTGTLDDPGPGMSMGSGGGKGMMPGGMPGMGGMPSMGSGGGGKGMMPPGGGGMGPPGMPGGMGGIGPAGGMSSPTGMEALQIAMADPLLISVRIGGLMTLYQSAQESDAAEQTAAAAANEATAAPPANPAPTDGNTAAPPADGTTTPAAPGTTPDGATVPAENATPGTVPATDAPGTTPAEGSAAPPAEGTPAEGTPASPATTDPATPGTQPAPAEPGAATGPPSTTPPATEGAGSGEGNSPAAPAPSTGGTSPQ
ncbi:MAG: hypothetical protein JNM43_28410 [Planctomycetaceae bacterium]|nr:hypothetical protein [Planctomycetaceae bacterium]